MLLLYHLGKWKPSKTCLWNWNRKIIVTRSGQYHKFLNFTGPACCGPEAIFYWPWAGGYVEPCHKHEKIKQCKNKMSHSFGLASWRALPPYCCRYWYWAVSKDHLSRHTVEKPGCLVMQPNTTPNSSSYSSIFSLTRSASLQQQDSLSVGIGVHPPSHKHL